MKQTFADRVNLDIDDHVAVITLDRAARMNAFDTAMYDGINEALVAFRDDDDARVAVIQAAGERAFSAGADVDALDANAARGITTGLGSLLLDREMLTDKPIIAAVHGWCVGEGVNLVLGCDMVMADSTAKFMISEVRIGVNPVDIPVKLALRMSYTKAFAFLTPGEARDADWAYRAGLVEQVFPAGEVQSGTLAFARRIADECAPLALRAQKATLWSATFDDSESARALGEARRTLIRQSADYREGRAAFREKRTPQFRGE